MTRDISPESLRKWRTVFVRILTHKNSDLKNPYPSKNLVINEKNSFRSKTPNVRTKISSIILFSRSTEVCHKKTPLSRGSLTAKLS